MVTGRPSAAKASKSGKRADARKKQGRSPAVERRIAKIRTKLAALKDLALKSSAEKNGRVKDRLVVMVRDPYWLHAYWELSRAGIERAQAAMGQHWHGARPVLRLCEVPRNATTSPNRKHIRDVVIHGGVN